jgi:hypothetical protein
MPAPSSCCRAGDASELMGEAPGSARTRTNACL